MLNERSSRMTTSRPPPMRRGGSIGRPVEHRSGEGRDEEQEDHRARQEQQPVANPLPPRVLVRRAQQEHQRRERRGLLPLLVHEVHEDRDGQRREADGEERGEE